MGKSHHHKKNCEKSCKKCTDTHTISQRDFNHHCSSSKTLVIDKPGKWIMTEDIVFSPPVERTSAIVIDSDNVVLDLCANTLSQNNQVDFITGIHVLSGRKNITIKNGNVTNFSQIGIDIDPAVEMVQLGEVDGNTKLVVSDCGHVGQYSNFDVAMNKRIYRAGIKIGASKMLLFNENAFADPTKEVNLDYVVSKRNGSFGIIMGNQQTTNIRNCNSDENYESRSSVPANCEQLLEFDPRPQGGGMFGFVSDPAVTPQWKDYGIKDLYVFNCSSSLNHVEGDHPICIGFGLAYTTTATFDNCVATKNRSDRTMYTFVFGGSSGIRVINSSATENYGAYRCDGFHQSGITGVNGNTVGYSHHAGTVFENCISTKNSAGFLLLSFYQFYPSDVSVINCISSENSAPIVVSFGGNGSDDFVQTALRGCSHIGCKSVNDGPDDNVTGYVSGFEMDDLNTGFLVQNCLFNRLPNPNIEMHGLIVDNSETIPDAFSISNGVVENNNFTAGGNGISLYGSGGILVKNNNLVGNQVGIDLGPSRYGGDLPSVCNVIQGNTITNPVNGIVDTSAVTSNFFTSNRVYGASGNSIDVNPLPPISAGTKASYPTNVDAISNVVIGDSCGLNASVSSLHTLSLKERTEKIKAAKAEIKSSF